LSIKDDYFASYKLLERALLKKGYTTSFNETRPATVTFTSPAGVSWQTRAAHLAYPFNSERARDVCINKEKAYALATERNFPAPYTQLLSEAISETEAATLFDRFGALVVKPADSSLSRGLTVGVRDNDQLQRAIAGARSVSKNILIQQQVKGEELRFTLINGKVEAVLLRQTAQVVGDGRSTVRKLIAKENEARSQIRLEHITYPQLSETLVSPALLNSAEVPSVGEIIELNRSTMVSGGCSVYEILDSVDASYVREVERLVAGLDAGFMVVDVFCMDYTAEATAANHKLIEFNSAPALKLYYACRDGKQFDIVSRLVTLIDEYLQR